MDTRHNAGFRVLDAFAARHGAAFRTGRDAAEASVGTIKLMKPLTFMNRSGGPVARVARPSGIEDTETIVVHDDIDLPFGRLRIRVGGGSGGQNGVRDVMTTLGPGFVRLKVGVGRPPASWSVENWVLSTFRDDERTTLREIVEAACDALDAIVAEGPERAGTRVHPLRFGPTSAPNVTDPSPDQPK